MTKFHDNILACYDRATDDQIRRGHDWYRHNNEIFARASGSKRTNTLCAMAAIASPQQDWGRVRESVINIWQLRENTPESIKAFANLLPHARDKLRAIQRDPQHYHPYIRGPKTRAFFINLAFPDLTHVVTIDRHTQAVCHGHKDNLPPIASANTHERYGDYYRDVAYDLGIVPSKLQATTWLVWKESP